MKFCKQSILAFLFSIIVFNSNAVQLSPQSQVSILTCGSGGELYSIFGHTAVRIYDSTTHMDLVFNYGTFDFRTEGFYVKFVRGKLDYMLSVSSFQDFINTYLEEDRSVAEQVLNLSYSEKQAIMDYLEHNYKGNNKYYKYDFFLDNCTSRVRDLLNKVLGHKLIWNKKANNDHFTFRKLLDPYIVTMPWVKFGFYLGLGSVTDKVPNYLETMFLPTRLHKGLELANIQSKTSINPLVSKTISIYESTGKNADSAPLITPEIVFGLLLILTIVLSYIQFSKGTQPYWFDLWLWTNTALAGFLVLFLWLFTDHKATANNFNFLWANPLWLLAIGTLVNKYVSKFKLNVQYLMIIVNFNLVIFSFMFIQSFHPAFVLIMLMLSIRAASNIWSIKRLSL